VPSEGGEDNGLSRSGLRRLIRRSVRVVARNRGVGGLTGCRVGLRGLTGGRGAALWLLRELYDDWVVWGRVGDTGAAGSCGSVRVVAAVDVHVAASCRRRCTSRLGAVGLPHWSG
jgi:hypothetical protein